MSNRHPERRNDAAFRRFRRRVTIALAVQTIGLAGSIAIGYNENRQRIDDICQATDLQNEGIIAYLQGLGADDDQITQARRFFPDRDCGT